jgi:hypothetical protein
MRRVRRLPPSHRAKPRAAKRRGTRDEARATVLEHGDIFFFYRPRVETRKVDEREDVQRFFMLLAAERDTRPHFRLFVLGRKKLPEIRPGEAHPEERNWAVNVLTTSDAERVRRELLAKEYPTATRGPRLVGAAKAVGEGRYQLVEHRGHSELAYALELPRKASPVQAEFGIKDTASYILAVKNPDVQVPGFPERQETAQFPPDLLAKFGTRRWIEADDPAMLDHEGVEILLLGAHGDEVEEDLGIDIDDEVETAHSAELFRTLRLRKEARMAPLFRGEFPAEEFPVEGEQVERPPGARMATQRRRIARVPAARSRAARGEFRCETCDETFETRSRYERHMMTAHPTPAPSAADVERTLEGVDFPKTRSALVAYAAKRLGADSPTLDLIRALPPRRYRDAADVAVALGEVKRRPPGRRGTVQRRAS